MAVEEREQLEGFDCSADFCGGLGDEVSDELRERCNANALRILNEARERSKGSDTWVLLSDNSAQPLTCASCGELSTNPGQFLADGRWVCTESCRKELALSQSYDDLRESGGIVDAP